jgi:hypothetical protein
MATAHVNYKNTQTQGFSKWPLHRRSTTRTLRLQSETPLPRAQSAHHLVKMEQKAKQTVSNHGITI